MSAWRLCLVWRAQADSWEFGDILDVWVTSEFGLAGLAVTTPDSSNTELHARASPGLPDVCLVRPPAGAVSQAPQSPQLRRRTCGLVWLAGGAEPAAFRRVPAGGGAGARQRDRWSRGPTARLRPSRRPRGLCRDSPCVPPPETVAQGKHKLWRGRAVRVRLVDCIGGAGGRGGPCARESDRPGHHAAAADGQSVGVVAWGRAPQAGRHGLGAFSLLARPAGQ